MARNTFSTILMSSAYRYFVAPCLFHSVLYSVRILYPARSPCFIPTGSPRFTPGPQSTVHSPQSTVFPFILSNLPKPGWWPRPHFSRSSFSRSWIFGLRFRGLRVRYYPSDCPLFQSTSRGNARFCLKTQCKPRFGAYGQVYLPFVYGSIDSLPRV